MKMQKKKGKKSIIGITVVGVGIILLRLMAGMGFGTGFGTKGVFNQTTDGMATRNPVSEVELTEKEEQNIVEEQDTEEQKELEDEKKIIIYSVTVVESDYFYDNSRISLTDFLDILKEEKEKLVVEIKEDKASLKAYNKLIDALEELEIKYSEVN